MPKLSAKVFSLRVVADNGERGGTVEIPVCRASVVDLGRTAGGGNGKLDLTIDHLKEMVSNFDGKPGPVPVYFDHANSNPRGPETPAAGFVTAIWVEGDVLWNRIELGPKAFDLIVRQRGFAAASIEATKDKVTPTASLIGWVETGLAITNFPALDVNYLAASESANASSVVLYSHNFTREESAMSVEFTAADKLKFEEKIVALETELATAKKASEEIVQLKAQVAELSKRPAPDKLLAMEAELASMREEGTKERVIAIVRASVAQGKPASFFEGAEKDPLTYLKTRFSGSLEMLRASADALPVVVKTTAASTQSGGTQLGDGSSPKDVLFAEVRKTQATLKLTFDDALASVRDTNPTIYASGMADYLNTPLPGSAPAVS
jgi:hypothetical protein